MDEAENAIDPNWQCADQLHDPAYSAGPDAWLATFAKVRARSGGQGGIRTHGELPPTAVFKTAALNHSATCPQRICARAMPIAGWASLARGFAWGPEALPTQFID